MAKRITAIPATRNRFTSAPVFSAEKKKVAGYARVSTILDEQQSSYENQVEYYTNFIKSHPDWEFAGMYTDEGITATSTIHREGFNDMIANALDGKIDLIITKSVSRFARNTVDSLTTVRKLKEKGVEVFFEKENIWTLDSKGELLITIMSSLAQEESRSISENTTWGKRKAFQDGKVFIAWKNFLGYDEGFKINLEQAKTVRLIYKLYLSGLSMCQIKKELEKRGLKTAMGKDNWHASAIKGILTNEKYKGDALLQKEFTIDFLTHKQKKNEGEVPQYYVEGHHDPIIDPATFDLVQEKMKTRTPAEGYYSGKDIYSSKIKCGDCGHWYGRTIWHSNEPKLRKEVYRCTHKYRGENKCTTPSLTKEQIGELFMSALEKLKKQRKRVTALLGKRQRAECATDELIEEMAKLTPEVEKLETQLRKLIDENKHTVRNQKEYAENYQKLYTLYCQKAERLESLNYEIKERKTRWQVFDTLINAINNIGDADEHFNEDLWGAIVDYMIVYDKRNAVITFISGYEVRVTE